MTTRQNIHNALLMLAVIGLTAAGFKYYEQPVDATKAPLASPSDPSKTDANPIDTTGSTAAAPPSAWRSEVESLRAELEDSKREREEMREEMITLQAQISSLQDAQMNETVATNNATLIEQNSAPPSAEEIAQAHSGRSTAGFGFGPLSNEERQNSLLAAGIDEQTIASITERSDEYQLARLELIDRASREGFQRTDQFREEMTELNESRVSIRDEIGDDAYDSYLSNAGRDNRVVVESIINGSAASIAGMQVGDIIYAYAGTRLFSSRELQQATRDGNRGELIDIQVQRPNAGQYTFTIERGPLGVTLGSASNAP